MDNINFHGIQTKAVNYKGVQIIQNSFTGNWMLFFKKEGKYPNSPPFVGKLSQMKGVINDAIRLGKDGENQLLEENTYSLTGKTK